jgi:biopolymer transport protein ExbB
MFSEAFEFLERGGPLMIPIGLCAVVGLAIFLERIWMLQRRRVLPPHFLSVLEPYLRDRRWDDVRRLCDSSESGIATVVRGGLRHLGDGRQLVREAMEEAGRRVTWRLERYLGMLGAVASVAPLLGLLGTVTGMIEVFQQAEDTIQATGNVEPAQLASGIWAALMTTAAGLTVAIPVFLGYKYLEGRIDRFVGELEEQADIFADAIARPVTGEAARSEGGAEAVAAEP